MSLRSYLSGKVANFVWFQTIWFIAIFYQNQFLSLIIILMMLHFVFSDCRLNDLVLALAIGCYGSVVDGLLRYWGFFVFSPEPVWFVPLWLFALWSAFGLMLRNSLGYLSGRYLIAAILGAISGPLSYFAGVNAGAVVFPHSTLTTLLVIATVWFITVPLWLYLNSWLNTYFDEQTINKQEER